MPLEIETKELLYENGESYATEAFFNMYSSFDALLRDAYDNGCFCEQGYLSIRNGMKVVKAIEMELPEEFEPTTARLRQIDDEYIFTLKGYVDEDHEGVKIKDEYEHTLTKKQFQKYWPKTDGHRISKIRLFGEHEGYHVEFDIFTGRNLILAEIELESADEVDNITPLGKDVSHDKKYRSKHLAKR